MKYRSLFHLVALSCLGVACSSGSEEAKENSTENDSAEAASPSLGQGPDIGTGGTEVEALPVEPDAPDSSGGSSGGTSALGTGGAAETSGGNTGSGGEPQVPIDRTGVEGLMYHDFNDGTLGPFVECTTKGPNYAEVQNQRLVTRWTEDGFDGGRVSKGAEACGAPNSGFGDVGYLTYKHGWFGMIMNIDPGYMADNPNTDAGLIQIFGFDDSEGLFSWTAMLKFEHGHLTWVDRVDRGGRYNALVVENFPKGVDVPIIVHVILSKENEGLVEIFVDGERRYHREATNIGMGDFTDEDTQSGDSYTEFKIGQYNYRNSPTDEQGYTGSTLSYDGYVEGEERIVYFDNVAWYDGEDGYDLVDPTNW